VLSTAGLATLIYGSIRIGAGGSDISAITGLFAASGASPPLHARRVGLEPLGDLLQLGGQLLPGGGLALLPLAVLVPDRPPAARLLTGRVHGDAVLQLDDFAAAPGGGAPGPAREDPGTRSGEPKKPEGRPAGNPQLSEAP
jgi:hypothetical protein